MSSFKVNNKSMLRKEQYRRQLIQQKMLKRQQQEMLKRQQFELNQIDLREQQKRQQREYYTQLEARNRQISQRSIFILEITLSDLLGSLSLNYSSDNNILNDYDMFDNFNDYDSFQDNKPDTITNERFNKFKKVSHVKDKECIICTDEYQHNDNIIQLDCGHCYHEKCIKKWLLDSSNKCPLCNKMY